MFKNGGGAFLIPYFILVFVLAIPLFYLEVALGQMKGMGLAHILQIEKPKLRGFGYMGITIGFIISTYYVFSIDNQLESHYGIFIGIPMGFTQIPTSMDLIRRFNTCCTL